MHSPPKPSLRPVVKGQLLLGVSVAAGTGWSQGADVFRLALPQKPWEVAVTLPGFGIAIDGLVSANRRRTVATNRVTGVTVSVILEEVAGPAKLEKCRSDLSTESKGHGSLQKKDIRLFERGEWVMLEYLAQIEGSSIREMNLFACSVKDDVYVNLQFSKAFYRPGQEELFNPILSSVRFENRDAAVMHYERGNALYQARDLAGAITAYRESIRLNPDFVGAHTALGNALDDSGETDGALAEYRQALRLQPSSADAHVNLGMLFARRGDLETALKEYQEAVRFAPESAVARFGLAGVLQEKGDVDGAIREYQVALSLNPDLADAYYFLGNALQTKRDVDGAIAAYRQAAALSRDDAKLAAVRTKLGVTLYLKNDADGAIAELREALRLEPNSATAHLVLANVLNAKGDRAGALQECQTATRLVPDDQEIRATCQGLSQEGPR